MSEKKRASSRCIGLTKEGLNTKLHEICDSVGRPIRALLTAGTISDYAGAAYLLPTLPSTRILPADRGYDAEWIRSFLRDHGCTPCIPLEKIQRLRNITTRTNIASVASFWIGAELTLAFWIGVLVVVAGFLLSWSSTVVYK